MIEINNLTKEKVDKNFLKRVAKTILKEENRKEAELSIALVSEKEIKKLNRKYRNKNKTTDVLSFETIGLGEIILCPSQIKKNAKKFGNSFKKEIARVLIHGVLHLLGYDHKETKKESLEMQKKEEYFINCLKIRN